jgi:hypothetical protein
VKRARSTGGTFVSPAKFCVWVIRVKKPLQKLIFFLFFCNPFCNDIIFRIIRVAEPVAEGLQKNGGYIVPHPPPITVPSPFRHTYCSVLQPFCNPYYFEYKYFMEKVAEKLKKIKFFMKIRSHF